MHKTNRRIGGVLFLLIIIFSLVSDAQNKEIDRNIDYRIIVEKGSEYVLELGLTPEEYLACFPSDVSYVTIFNTSPWPPSVLYPEMNETNSTITNTEERSASGNRQSYG